MDRTFEIRKARTGDVHAIHALLSHYAKLGMLLPRALSELYDHLRDYVVLEERGGQSTDGEKDGERILGVCGLGICWEDLAEIRSLAVAEELQRCGLGRRLVEACLEEARAIGLRRVFTLTYVPGFFSRLGFSEVDKSVLPHKVWADCLKCPKFPDCDEIAMIRKL